MAGLLLAAAPAAGQVNTEKLRSWEADGISGHVDFALRYKSGNVDELLVGSSARVQWAQLGTATSSTAKRPLAELVYLIGDFTLGIRSEERYKNAGFGHLRWTHVIRRWVATEAFAQAQYNEFIRLQQRYLGGAGVRFEPIHDKHVELTVGTGYMLEFEQNDVPEDGPDAREVLAHRSTSYLSLEVYLEDPAVTLIDTIYVQPRLTDFGDYRILNEAELSVAITDVVSLVASSSLRYDSDPVLDIEKLDLAFLNKLRLSF